MFLQQIPVGSRYRFAGECIAGIESDYPNLPITYNSGYNMLTQYLVFQTLACGIDLEETLASYCMAVKNLHKDEPASFMKPACIYESAHLKISIIDSEQL